MLVVARHGSTLLNERSILQGSSDEPLSELGRRQSAALADALQNLLDARPAVLLSSPAPRASQTADMLSLRLSTPVTYEPDLTERDFGVFDGMTRAELEKTRRIRGRDNFDPVHDWNGFPDVEWDHDVWKRVLRVLEQHGVLDYPPHQHAVMITHAGVAKAILQMLFGIPLQRHRCFRISPAGYVAFRLEEGRLELTHLWPNPVVA